jgi:hypothetical protein
MSIASLIFFDYHVIDFVVGILLTYIWYYFHNIPPNRLYIIESDSRNKYPHYEAGITETTNLIIVNLIPIFIYLICYFIVKFGTQNTIQPFDLLGAIISHFCCICFSNIIAGILKIKVGRARPDFFDVIGEISNNEVLQPKNLSTKQFYEEFESFHSGHSLSQPAAPYF